MTGRDAKKRETEKRNVCCRSVHVFRNARWIGRERVEEDVEVRSKRNDDGDGSREEKSGEQETKKKRFRSTASICTSTKYSVWEAIDMGPGQFEDRL